MFIALDLPRAAIEGIVAWGKRELCDPALRIVPAESLHVTLVFLGWRPEKEIDRLAEMIGTLRSPAPTIELGDPVAKPSPGRPHLFALPARSDGAIALQAELEQKLLAARLYEPEKRPFWPHVTVARVKSAGRGSRHPMKVAAPPKKLSNPLIEPNYLCIRVRLYRSELNPTGARYTPLAQIELSDDGRQ